MSIFLKSQLLGEGQYTETEIQTVYNEETLTLFPIAIFNAWDKIEKTGKRLEPFT